MRKENVQIAMIVVNLFAAISAFAGAIGLVVGYLDIPLSVLRTTPFADFTVPALLLGIVVGGVALVAAAIALFGPQRFDALAALALAFICSLWLRRDPPTHHREHRIVESWVGHGATPSHHIGLTSALTREADQTGATGGQAARQICEDIHRRRRRSSLASLLLLT